jgi:hypothetical protein
MGAADLLSINVPLPSWLPDCRLALVQEHDDLDGLLPHKEFYV